MRKDKINIIIADDHILFIEGLISLLEKEKSFHIAGKAQNSNELLHLLGSVSANVVLLDINMPSVNGLEMIKQVKMVNSSVKIIMLSTYGEEYLIEKAADLGANGYMLKTTSKERLIDAIKQVESGKFFFEDKDFVSATSISKSENAFVNQFQLTNRELEIIQNIKEGHTSQQIADRLFLSVLTVSTHRKNIAKKLGLNNVASLMKFIVENDI